MELTLSIGKETLKFNVSLNDYEAFINDVEAKNKVVPAKRFLKRTIDKADAEKLNAIIAKGLTMQITAEIIGAFVPEVEITVSKSSGAQEK